MHLYIESKLIIIEFYICAQIANIYKKKKSIYIKHKIIVKAFYFLRESAWNVNEFVLFYFENHKYNFSN